MKRCFLSTIPFVFLSLSACAIISYRAIDNVDDYIFPCPKSAQEVAKECLLVLKEQTEVHFYNNQTLEEMYVGVINKASGENLKQAEKKHTSDEEAAIVNSIEREEIANGAKKFDFANDVSVSAPYESGMGANCELPLLRAVAEDALISRHTTMMDEYLRFGDDHYKKKKVFEKNLFLKITNGDFNESAVRKDKLLVVDYRRSPRVEENSVTTSVELEASLETVEGVLIKQYSARAEETEWFGFPSAYSSSNNATCISSVKAFQKALFNVFSQIAKDNIDELQERAKKKHDERIKTIKESARLQFKKKKDLLLKKYGEKQAYLILEKRIGLGMTKEALIESWGKPRNINESTGPWGVHRQYVYRSAYVYVENGSVVSWQIEK